MNKIVCAKCGELKPEISFELNRGGGPRKKCRACRNAEKLESSHRCGLPRKGPSFGSRCYLRGFIEEAW